jgi:hypothetical protein
MTGTMSNGQDAARATPPPDDASSHVSTGDARTFAGRFADQLETTAAPSA